VKEQFRPLRSPYLFLSPITCFPEYNRCICGTQRLTAAHSGVQVVHSGAPMAKNGTKVAQKGAQAAQNGSQRFKNISPKPHCHLKNKENRIFKINPVQSTH